MSREGARDEGATGSERGKEGARLRASKRQNELCRERVRSSKQVRELESEGARTDGMFEARE